jgi:RimJ/RimL family protein N-acetyltransferase
VTHAAGIPVIETARLVLRAPRREDFEPFAAVFADARSRHMGGPVDRVGAWKMFAMGVAQWALTGFGVWSVADRATGAYCGDVGLLHPPHYPEIELGWTLVAEAEGRGIAHEAAAAARDWAFGTLGLGTLVSYIDPENARSIRLAERLCARHDASAARPDPEDLVYRHPGPSARDAGAFGAGA